MIPMLSVITGFVVQLLKKVPYLNQLNSTWYPLVSILVGLGVSRIAAVDNFVLTGIAVGLVACGGYDVVKGLIEGVKQNAS